MFVLGADEGLALDAGHVLGVSAADVAASGHTRVIGWHWSRDKLVNYYRYRHGELLISDIANESLLTISDTSIVLTDYH